MVDYRILAIWDWIEIRFDPCHTLVAHSYGIDNCLTDSDFVGIWTPQWDYYWAGGNPR